MRHKHNWAIGRVLLTLVLVSPCVASACATKAPSAATSISTAQTTRKAAPILFISIHGKPFPYPLIKVRINGERATMMLDTGSNEVVLSRDVVKRLGLATTTLQYSGTDGVRSVRLAKVLAPNITVQGLGKLPPVRVLVTPLPKAFDKLGIAGVLSPQRLVQKGHSITVNFITKQLVVTSSAAASAHLGAISGVVDVPTVFHPTSGAPQYGVTAQISGVQAKLKLDTGSMDTAVFADSAIGKTLAQSRPFHGQERQVASGAVKTNVVSNVAIRVGGVTKTTNISIMPSSHNSDHFFQGRLGMRFLRRCVLVLSGTGSKLACHGDASGHNHSLQRTPLTGRR